MRFCVTYKVKQIPLTYRMSIYSLVKEAVRLSDSNFYKKLFIKEKEKTKPFSFSAFLKNFSFQDTIIELDQITITISSPDMEFLLHAFNGMRKLKEYEVNGEKWVQAHVQILNEQMILNRKAVFKTLSSILIEDKEGKPLSPTDANFEKELNYYANLQIQQFAGRTLYKPIIFTPIRMKKQVVKEKNRHLKEGAFLYFTTYGGRFVLEGHPEDLQLLYQLGIGKRSTYFGLLEYEGKEV